MSTVVFVGPSLSRAAVQAALPGARVEPPVTQGDIAALHAAGADTFLIIDGAFAHQRAVSPGEIVAAVVLGARVLGAASLGAIRAAECEPAGMLGLGAVYTLYRHRVISSDDEVAVAYGPDDLAPVSTALIDVRYGVLAALRAGLLGRPAAAAVLSTARDLHFSERRWETIFARAGVDPVAELLACCRAIDVKGRDARRALAALAGLRPPEPADVRRPDVRRPDVRRPDVRRPDGGAARCRSHDPYLGYPVETLRDELTRWLLGSGEYRRYATLRPSRPAEVLGTELWSQLQRSSALGAELMRWYAHERFAALCGADEAPPGAAELESSRLEVAARHGYGDWQSLQAGARAGRLEGMVPLAWAQAAAVRLARARIGARRFRAAPDLAGERLGPHRDQAGERLGPSKPHQDQARGQHDQGQPQR